MSCPLYALSVRRHIYFAKSFAPNIKPCLGDDDKTASQAGERGMYVSQRMPVWANRRFRTSCTVLSLS